MKKEFIQKHIVYIIILLIIVIYFVTVLIMIKKDSNNEIINTYFVTDNSIFYLTRKDDWQLVSDTSSYNWKDYNIYINNKYLGEYKLQYNNKWYIFDEQRNSIKYDGKLLASSNIDIDVYVYSLADINANEKEKIDNYILNQNIDLVEYSLINSKIEIDIDDDGKIEKLYIVTSPINNNPNNLFSMILIEKSNKIQSIVSNVVKTDSNDNLTLYNIYGFIDINKDGNKEIIISQMFFSQPDTSCEMIFKPKQGTYTKLVGCK